ncbi:hypothetical protein HOD75_01190 [archaeon]|jgi:hypothetical protein|nr:hypothetical protein [archaeon]MBT4241493.1 hypothetical protein [archaeon]MBT4417636.1 hypothetical protein [archaeon]
MKQNFIFFIFVFFLIILVNTGFVLATGFSPSEIVEEINVGEEICQIINVNSDSSISITDKWAESVDVEWKSGLFESSAVDHGININYDNELDVDEREVEVCMSGSVIGEYHGIILLSQEQQGNSIVQMGVWVKLTIAETPIEEPGTPSAPPQSSSGSSSGGTALPPANNTISNDVDVTLEVVEPDVEENTNIIEPITNEETTNKFSITGAVIGAGKNNYKIIIIVAVVLMVGVELIYSRRKKNIKESDYIHNNNNNNIVDNNNIFEER